MLSASSSRENPATSSGFVAFSVDVRRAEEALQALQQSTGHPTPFQTASWIRAYFSGLGDIRNFALITIAGKEFTLNLPLEIRISGLARVADFPGRKHASFHAPVLAGSLAISPSALHRALGEAGTALGIDAYTFRDCPFEIAGTLNPMLALRHAISPSPLAMLKIEGDGEALLQQLSDKDDRKKLRQMERRLVEIGEITHGWAASTEIEAVLDAVFVWKAARFAQMGIDDPFAPAEAKAYLRQATAGEIPAMRLYVLRSSGKPVAVLGGASANGQFCAVVIAHDPDPVIERTSPGIVLLSYFVKRLADDGFQHFDLGVGEARYKARFCPVSLDLFDAALGVTLRGKLAAWIFMNARALKRMFKRSHLAMRLLGWARKLRT